MKKHIHLFLIFSMYFFIGCKKDSVDSTNLQTFQSSINDMASNLNTLQQIKFNEALYILKTFGVEAEGDRNEMNALRELLSGKKVPQIFSMADQVASQNGVEWTSNGPPSLGDMNIFDSVTAKEHDPNDVEAKSLDIQTKYLDNDGVLGAKSVQVIPRLVDDSGSPINFEGATLETTMEVFSNGVRLTSSKNLMLDNNFKGFTLRFPNLPAEKILNNKVDITVSVKTTDKIIKMTKVGVPVNPSALRQTPVKIETPNYNDSISTDPDIDFNQDPIDTPSTNNNANPASGSPKVTVQRFLNHLSNQNLKAAYETSSNPTWGSYENFSNPNSGFGAVKKISVKNISQNSLNNDNASINATYDVTDKNGKTTALQVTFGLKNVNGEWKISSYKIN